VFGLDYDHDGRSAAAVDIDGDGDLDLALLTLTGLRLLENRSASRHFARVRLTGTRTQPHALGAEVTLRADGVVRRDFVKITEGFMTQVPLDLHFGLGDSSTIDALEVRWPSGEVEVWTDLSVDQLLLVREGAAAVEARPLDRWPESSRPNVAGSPSPTVDAEQLDGDVVPLAGGRRPTVINFWAPWCVPCNVELPQLVNLAARYDDEVDFVGVSVELKDLPSVRARIAQFGVPYAQFLADESVMSRFFGDVDQAVLPSTFVFDDRGRLRRLVRGAITEADLDALLSSFRDEGLSEAKLSFLARAHLDEGYFDGAIDYYRRLLDLEPNLEQRGPEWERRRGLDHFNLGKALLRSERAEEAVGNLETALQRLGDDYEVLIELGVAAAVVGQLQLASDALGRAVQLDPESAHAWLNKARVHRDRGEVGAARDSYAQVIRLDSTDSQARRELGALQPDR